MCNKSRLLIVDEAPRALCNGKSCGTGKHVGGGHWVCIHNSLATLDPEVAAQWHPTKNGALTPNDVTKSTHKEVFWLCKNNPCGCHFWKAAVYSRTCKNRNGCPYCANKLLCDHNNLQAKCARLAEEWHEDNEKSPSKYAPMAGDVVKWRCRINSKHVWEAAICDRNNKARPKGCPYCNIGKPHEDRNFATEFPELLCEWDYIVNGDPTTFSPCSYFEVQWICKNNTKHIWTAEISRRTSSGCGCPFCNKGAAHEERNLATEYHDFLLDWDYKANGDPRSYSPHAGARVSWICRFNPEHRWYATINQRTGRGNGCPNCSKIGSSQKEIAWLRKIESIQDIKIRKATDTEGQYHDGDHNWKFDGYCEETNTVYEFHGCFWHNCPSCFPHYDESGIPLYHPVNGKLCREVYEKTIQREDDIRNSGYNLVSIWEHEYNTFIRRGHEKELPEALE